MPVGALSLATSVALGNPFSGPNPQGGNLTWSGFSNGSVAASISGNNGASYENVLAGQFVGFFDPNSEADAPGASISPAASAATRRRVIEGGST